MRIPYTLYIPPLKDPTALPNLRFWVRADLGVTTVAGSKVSQWNDQSLIGDPNHNLVQSNDPQRPVLLASDSGYNNQSTVSFTRASNTYIQSPTWVTPMSQPCTYYAVANSDGQNVYYEDVFDGDTNGFRMQLSYVTGFWGIAAGGAGLSISNNASTGPNVFCCVFNGPSSSALYINSSTNSSALGSQPPASNSTLMVLGSAKNADSSVSLQGRIAEVIAYETAHDSTTRAAVMRYLGLRYGITVS
jgi:hypothetical protein